MFGNFDSRQGTPSATDTALSERIMSYWVNFAKSGDPNGQGLPNWPAFTEAAQQDIGIQIHVVSLPAVGHIHTYSITLARLVRAQEVRLIGGIGSICGRGSICSGRATGGRCSGSSRFG